MLKSFHHQIEHIGFVYAHCGLKEDKGNRIYSIGSAVVSPGNSKKEYHSLVSYSGITGREKFYSNVSREMLINAPSPEEITGQLGAFLKGLNVVFCFNEHAYLENIQRFCRNVRIVDLSFASEFFLPYLKSFSLNTLWEFIYKKPRKVKSFSASEIVDLSIEFVKYVCNDILNDQTNPRACALRYYLKKSDSLFGDVFIYLAENYRKYFEGLFDPVTKRNTENWTKFLEKSIKSSGAASDEDDFKPISPETIDELYKALSQRGFRYRTEQVQYARHIAGALNDNAVLTIEAGTGTGKTQGYLIPVMEFLRLNRNKRVVISTYTKNLQEQIFQRELPVTKELLPAYRDVSVALLKGKSSYICSEKLNHLYEEGLRGENLLTWLYFINMIFYFRNADADSIGENVKFYLNGNHGIQKIFNEISAKEGCNSKHTRCPAQIITAEAVSARLIITNHHKLALLDNDSILSGLFNHYIIDEANHFEHAVRSAFGEEVHSWEISIVLEYLESAIRRIQKRVLPDYSGSFKDAVSAINHLRLEMRNFRHALVKMNPKAESGTVCELYARHIAFTNGDIGNDMDSMKELILKINKHLQIMKDADSCRMMKIQSKTVERIKTALRQLMEYTDSITLIKESIPMQGMAASYQVFAVHWTLTVQKVDVADLIRYHIYDKKNSVVYTAATLSHRNSFDCFKTILGMNIDPAKQPNNAPAKEFRFTVIPSPFSKDLFEIIVPDEAVSGKYENKEIWLKSIARIVPDLIRKNKGRTLVLFSSYSDLIAVSDRIIGAIEDDMYPVLIQQKGSSTVNMCDEFREIKESVLLGVDTFWYGVDFKGDTLTQVIITRIPYPSPSEPLQIARKKNMPAQEYWKRYYYDTEIKMKQGIGRLIRSDTDRGKVIILDSRFRKDIEPKSIIK